MYRIFQSPLLVQFVPTLLLWLVSSLLPNIVFYTDYYLIGHWTRCVCVLNPIIIYFIKHNSEMIKGPLCRLAVA